jgi:hypothetical protein
MGPLPLHALPTALNDQFQALLKAPAIEDTDTIKNIKSFRIENTSIEVGVLMERTLFKSQAPKAVPVCSGRLVKQKVVVTVSPEDPKVVDFISAYLKSQEIPAMMMNPVMRVFDIIEINNKIIH